MIPTQTPKNGQGTGMSIRLLLADDHRMLREGLRRSMEEVGFEVVGEASDGEDAVRQAVELKPDVVLMDVTMPGSTPTASWACGSGPPASAPASRSNPNRAAVRPSAAN